MRKLALFPLAACLLAACSNSSGAADDAKPVARVNGKEITDAELTAEAKGAIHAADAKYAEDVHNAKAAALQGLIERRLLEAKARAEGLTIEALLAREVNSKVHEPDEAMLRSVYEQTKATRPVPPYEQSRDDIARFVKNEELQQLRQAYLARLKAEAKVETMLPPLLLPKVEFRADGPSKGDPKAKVTLVEFSDYECSFCARAEPTVARVLESYPGRVRFVFQSYPLSIHPSAPKASEAALCAGEQGKYWEMHDTLFANQQALGVDALKGYARKIGLDGARFDACLDGGKTARVVQASRELGEGLGINSTPMFYVNGRPLNGAMPFERFKELIDHELASAGR